MQNNVKNNKKLLSSDKQNDFVEIKRKKQWKFISSKIFLIEMKGYASKNVL